MLKFQPIYKSFFSTERDRTRTCNPQIRSLVPYPLGHTPSLDKGMQFNPGFEHAALWSGVRRATVAQRSKVLRKIWH